MKVRRSIDVRCLRGGDPRPPAEGGQKNSVDLFSYESYYGVDLYFSPSTQLGQFLIISSWPGRARTAGGMIHHGRLSFSHLLFYNIAFLVKNVGLFILTNLIPPFLYSHQIKSLKVDDITPGGWADRTGLVLGDEIVSVTSVRVGGTRDFRSLSPGKRNHVLKLTRPLEMTIKRHASITLDLLGRGIDPESLPKGTFPKKFKMESVLTIRHANADGEPYVPSPSHPDDSYFELETTGNEQFGMRV